MLLNQYNKVVKLDEQITSLHEQLAELYAVRATLLQGSTDIQRGNAQFASNELANDVKQFAAETVYDELAAAWDRVCIKIPPFKALEKPLLRALDSKQLLESSTPILKDKM